MATAARCLDLTEANRLVVLNQFDKRLTPAFAGFVEAPTTFLIREGVLPHLHFVPVRSRPGPGHPGARAAASAADPQVHAQAHPHHLTDTPTRPPPRAAP